MEVIVSVRDSPGSFSRSTCSMLLVAPRFLRNGDGPCHVFYHDIPDQVEHARLWTFVLTQKDSGRR